MKVRLFVELGEGDEYGQNQRADKHADETEDLQSTEDSEKLMSRGRRTLSMFITMVEP